jgi:SPP1 family predicted phage head-tail adaptor
MIYTSCKLLQRTINANEIGVQVETVTEREIPIIKVEDIYSKEFYEANEQGYKPELRLRISALNYNGEPELEYGGIIYTVIRVQTPAADETILICERKIKNV